MMKTVSVENHTVYRIGRVPDPWAFSEHRYSGGNHWDDPELNFRTIFAGNDLFSCYVEVLAPLRPDVPAGTGLLDEIIEDPDDALRYPTPAAGAVPRNWLEGRMSARATMVGQFVDVTAADTICDLRPRFLGLARKLGFPDFDAAALKTAHPRELTQRVAARLYALRLGRDRSSTNGVLFASRHGDDLKLWEIFEQPSDGTVSMSLSNTSAFLVDVDDPELGRALEHHGLHWA